MKRAILAMSAAAAAGAAGQTPSFVYTMQVPAVVFPGQTFVITVLCGFSPGIGQPVSTPAGARPVQGLSSGAFNIVAAAGNWSSVALLAPYTFQGSSPGTPAGGNVSGVLFGTGFGPPFVTLPTVNPTPIWRGVYTMPSTYVEITINPVGRHAVWAGKPGETAVEVFSQKVAGTQWGIPCPAVATVLLTAAAFSRRRRVRV